MIQIKGLAGASGCAAGRAAVFRPSALCLERRTVDDPQTEIDDMEAARANKELDKAERELADAQKDIDNIEPPDWLVMDRSKNVGLVSFENDSERIDAIASFFPFIFFLVAALVALTTMTRMVDEERMLIGTYKALGYSRARITSKYLIYAALAAGLGSIVGKIGRAHV